MNNKEIKRLITRRLQDAQRDPAALPDIAWALGRLREVTPRRLRESNGRIERLQDLQQKVKAAEDSYSPQTLKELTDALNAYLDEELGKAVDAQTSKGEESMDWMGWEYDDKTGAATRKKTAAEADADPNDDEQLDAGDDQLDGDDTDAAAPDDEEERRRRLAEEDDYARYATDAEMPIECPACGYVGPTSEQRESHRCAPASLAVQLFREHTLPGLYDPLVVEPRPVRRRVRQSESAVHKFRRSYRGIEPVRDESAVDAFRRAYAN